MASEGTVLDPRAFLQNLRRRRYREVLMAGATGAAVLGAVVLFPGVDAVRTGIGQGLGPGDVLAFLAVATVAAATKGAVGFGFGMVAAPVVATLIDPTLAVIVLAVPQLMLNLFQVGDTGTGPGYVRREWALVGLAVVGGIIGVFFLARFEAGPVVPFLLGLFILGYAVFELLSGFLVVERAHNPVALGTAGFLEGFLVSAASLGPLLPAYLHSFERDTEQYVGGISIVVGAVLLVRIPQMVAMDLLTPARLWLGSVIAVGCIGGLLAGTYLRRLEIDSDRLNRVVVALLTVVALNLLRKTAPTLFG